MVKAQPHDDPRNTARNAGNDERVLVDRLVRRQGLSRDEATRLVDDYREGKRAEIDPALMEGLDTL
jgi:polyhydroxyalkanoate synthesis regulator phasin